MLSNPFAELVSTIPAGVMQTYVVLMFLLVVGGTILDMLHKKSAKYFFQNAEKAKKNATKTITSAEKTSMAISVPS